MIFFRGTTTIKFDALIRKKYFVVRYPTRDCQQYPIQQRNISWFCEKTGDTLFHE